MNAERIDREELLQKSALWARDQEYLECVRDILDNEIF